MSCSLVNKAIDDEALIESRCFLVKEPLEVEELLESECILDGAPSDTLVILTHGAGANMRSEFMQDLAAGLVNRGAEHGIGVLRFNFPYMRANVLDGKRRPPDRAPKILKDFNIHITAIKRQYSPRKIILMGKSMGGRMSAIVAAETLVDGVICLGYPFIPLKGGEPRLAPIEESLAPICVIQGERDKFGCKGQVELWPVMNKTRLHWLVDGDHSFKPRKSSGTTQEANLNQAISHSINFIRSLDA
ncbi:alpha/beta fold hydrolase [Shewanella eurypsychrophilus]|uniref:Alpha/beta fold hydrolase n=1 Tax=Shewanella eurypsychrophilus TaxID=2593656 RepID=A0ABX6V8V4_9GAMM|nr:MULTISPECIES: alpha/beta fold hydrolase [Shewanella]QFU23892.1 dienelactone hydrolase [Shewanella sp. YLB-09]QPG59113.1 alpha/beta fold hydrolase [Shewanella eurypsychrophilus]